MWILHCNRAFRVQKKGTHQDISGIFWFIDPKSLSAVVDHNNHCQSVDFGCCMTGQHPGLRKYWRSSHYAEKDDLLYSLDGGRKAFFVHWSVHQWWKMRQNQWLELPNWYAASQNEQTICRRQTRFSGKWAAKRLLAAKKIEMHDPTWS